MIENFDDDKLASEQSFCNMAQKYSNLNTQNGGVVSVLSDDESLDLTNLALNVERVGDVLKKLSKVGVNNETRQFFSKLYEINKLEIGDIVRIFELKDFEKHNPSKGALMPNSVWGLVVKVIIYEAKNIQEMLEAMNKNVSKDKKQWLYNAINRRIDMIELILE